MGFLLFDCIKKKTVRSENFASAAKRVNCVSFRPGTMAHDKPHCDMADGREGYCPVYLKKGDCSYRVLKVKPLTSDEILTKVRMREERKQYERRCVNAGICPDCGEEIEYFSKSKDPLDRGCVHCDKIWVKNTIY